MGQAFPSASKIHPLDNHGPFPRKRSETHIIVPGWSRTYAILSSLSFLLPLSGILFSIQFMVLSTLYIDVLGDEFCQGGKNSMSCNWMTCTVLQTSQLNSEWEMIESPSNVFYRSKQLQSCLFICTSAWDLTTRHVYFKSETTKVSFEATWERTISQQVVVVNLANLNWYTV